MVKMPTSNIRYDYDELPFHIMAETDSDDTGQTLYDYFKPPEPDAATLGKTPEPKAKAKAKAAAPGSAPGSGTGAAGAGAGGAAFTGASSAGAAAGETRVGEEAQEAAEEEEEEEEEHKIVLRDHIWMEDANDVYVDVSMWPPTLPRTKGEFA